MVLDPGEAAVYLCDFCRCNNSLSSASVYALPFRLVGVHPATAAIPISSRTFTSTLLTRVRVFTSTIGTSSIDHVPCHGIEPCSPD